MSFLYLPLFLLLLAKIKTEGSLTYISYLAKDRPKQVKKLFWNVTRYSNFTMDIPVLDSVALSNLTLSIFTQGNSILYILTLGNITLGNLTLGYPWAIPGLLYNGYFFSGLFFLSCFTLYKFTRSNSTLPEILPGIFPHLVI